MNYKEFGINNKEVIILLHGGGLSWWNYKDQVKLLEKDYHVILPILDGHGDSDREFSSIEDNAASIISFINEHLEKRVLLIAGLSLGGQILLEMLSLQSDICRYAIVESASVFPSKVASVLINPALMSSYGLLKNKTFAKLQFKSLKIKEELFEDYYQDTCKISKNSMVSFIKASTSYSLKETVSNCQAKVYVLVGQKESQQMLKSAKIIHRKIENSELKIFKNLYHGQFSINYPENYARLIKTILSNDKNNC
ncbi:MAG: alpha/beta hydrolase [Erysipelotrichia bacterium]|nr:alpha/beta hydrolase [Erysipelotrichia bacterium]